MAMLNVDTRVIMRKALEHKASSLIVCHNHPSGDPEPSPADIVFTEKLKGAAQLLEIRLLDHVIITSGGYYSFADHSKI
jgi:DNA repair protein RadC